MRPARGGLILVAGTGLFMKFRHGVPFRRPALWFTAKPIARAESGQAPCPPARLLAQLIGDAVAFVAILVGLSYLSGFWLTYMDGGVWALIVGAIKVGPAIGEIAEREARRGAGYLVAARPLRGLVRITVV